MGAVTMVATPSIVREGLDAVAITSNNRVLVNYVIYRTNVAARFVHLDGKQ